MERAPNFCIEKQGAQNLYIYKQGAPNIFIYMQGIHKIYIYMQGTQNLYIYTWKSSPQVSFKKATVLYCKTNYSITLVFSIANDVTVNISHYL